MIKTRNTGFVIASMVMIAAILLVIVSVSALASEAYASSSEQEKILKWYEEADENESEGDELALPETVTPAENAAPSNIEIGDKVSFAVSNAHYWESPAMGGSGNYGIVSSANQFIKPGENVRVDGWAVLKNGEVHSSFYAGADFNLAGNAVAGVPSNGIGSEWSIMVHIAPVKGGDLGWITLRDISTITAKSTDPADFPRLNVPMAPPNLTPGQPEPPYPDTPPRHEPVPLGDPPIVGDDPKPSPAPGP